MLRGKRHFVCDISDPEVSVLWPSVLAARNSCNVLLNPSLAKRYFDIGRSTLYVAYSALSSFQGLYVKQWTAKCGELHWRQKKCRVGHSVSHGEYKSARERDKTDQFRSLIWYRLRKARSAWVCHPRLLECAAVRYDVAQQLNRVKI